MRASQIKSELDVTLRELALLRLTEAKALLKNGHYDGAYYLSGYIIECALKACVAKQTQKHQFPDKKTADASHTHKLEDLLKVAQLGDVHREQARANLVFEANWNLVRDWSEQSRYRKYSGRRKPLFPQFPTKSTES